MDRRELIRHIALLTGTAVIGVEFFLFGCTNTNKVPAGLFSEKDISFFDEVAETILPKTETPGAKDAEVGKFMASFSTDCYDEIQLKTLKEGINKLNDASREIYSVSFMDSSALHKQLLLIATDVEAKEHNRKNNGQVSKEPHYFTLMKQMTLLGFFSSKPGATQVLRYEPVPGKYEGCIDYKKGETSWA